MSDHQLNVLQEAVDAIDPGDDQALDQGEKHEGEARAVPVAQGEEIEATLERTHSCLHTHTSWATHAKFIRMLPRSEMKLHRTIYERVH